MMIPIPQILGAMMLWPTESYGLAAARRPLRGRPTLIGGPQQPKPLLDRQTQRE
jgi:hypothetical protein